MKINSARVALAAAITWVLGFTIHSLFALMSPTWFVKLHAKMLYIANPEALVQYIKFSWGSFFTGLIGAVSVFIFVWIFAEVYNMLDKEPGQ
jgi:hypothetical protein